MVFAFVFFISSIYAQTGIPDKEISVSFKNIPLEKVINELSGETGMDFSYNPNAIPVDTVINYSCKNKKIQLVFEEIFTGAGIQFELIGNHIVLKEVNADLPAIEEKIEKKYTISGYIVDGASKEVLIGAAVYNPETGLGTLSNNYGFFSITLPAGRYTLQTSFLGYAVGSRIIELNSNQTWDIDLEPVQSMVEEVVISSINREELIFNSLAAQTKVEPFEIKQETAVLGETDMLKSFDNLPGISFQSDGSSYFFVRGGSRDQNLILLDEAPIYNPSHMLGLFTPIIPEAVKSATIYKADFPVEYGGKLSSVIDIRTKDGNMNQLSGSASFGLVSARMSLEGPIIKDKSSYFLSFRRSYFGWLFKLTSPNLRDMFFTDFTSKVNIKLTKKDRLFVTLYHGQDKFLAKTSDNLVNGLEWSNTSFTLRWNHIFGERLFSNTTFYSSNYNYFLHTDYDRGFNWNSKITGTHLKSEFTYFLNPQNRVKFGAKFGGYFFNPGNYSDPNISDELTVSEVNSAEFILYGGNEHTLAEKFLISYGLRINNWSDFGEAFIVQYRNHEPAKVDYYKKGENYYSRAMLEPRLSLSYKVATFSSLKASYNRTVQNVHLINNSLSPFNSLEVWLPSGPNIKPQFSSIYNVGYIHAWPEKAIDFSVDFFYKTLQNQIGFIYHSKMLLNPFIEGEIRQGNGKAYGFEMALKKTQGRFTGQISYAFTRSLLKIPELFQDEYPARQDKPVDFSVSAGYFIKPRWLLSANFIYTSGLMTTVPAGFYNYRGTQVPLYTKPNNARMPDYMRFDIGSDFRLNKTSEGRFEHHLILSFYNFFNYRNAAFLYFTKTTDADGNFIIPADKLNSQEQIPTYRYVFSIIPSLTYNLRF